MRQDQSGKHALKMEDLDVHFGFSFSSWRNHRLLRALTVWHCVNMDVGQVGQSVAILPLLTWSSYVVQKIASALPSGSRIFSMVFYLWIACVGLLVRGTQVETNQY